MADVVTEYTAPEESRVNLVEGAMDPKTAFWTDPRMGGGSITYRPEPVPFVDWM